MDEQIIPTRLLKTKTSWIKPRGRPCTRWTDQLKRNVESRWGDWRREDEMQDWAYRESWRLPNKSSNTSMEVT
jgi:hypothetical protein